MTELTEPLGIPDLVREIVRGKPESLAEREVELRQRAVEISEPKTLAILLAAFEETVMAGSRDGERYRRQNILASVLADTNARPKAFATALIRAMRYQTNLRKRNNRGEPATIAKVAAKVRMNALLPTLLDMRGIPECRPHVLRGVVAMDPRCEATIDSCLKGLRAKEVGEREIAAWTLRALGADPLEDGEPKNEEYSDLQFCDRARRALPALIKALSDRSERVVEQAIRALGRIGSASTRAVPILMKCVLPYREAVSEAAAWALGRIAEVKRVPNALLLLQTAVCSGPRPLTFAAAEGMRLLHLGAVPIAHRS